MKMELLKIKLAIIIILSFASSCSSKDFQYEDFLKLSSSHSLKDEKIQKWIKNYINRNGDYKYYKTNTGIIFINKHDYHNICVALVDFNSFKNNRDESYKNLKGYFKIDDLSFLLFGDIEDFFDKVDKVPFENNLLGKLPEFNKENPPIIFEPNYECFEYKKGKIMDSYMSFNPAPASL